MSVGYLRDTIKGVSWMGGLRASTRVLAFIKIAILARLLLPEQFGLFGIAALVLVFLERITETGINIFLIQEKADLRKYVNTAFVISIARGILVGAILFLLAPFIASFFDTPDAVFLLRLITFVPILRGLINPSIVRFQKELLFNKEFFLRFSIFTFDATVAIVVAYLTKTAASLVWGLTAGVILEVFLSHLLIKPRPRFEFELAKIKKVINRGKWFTAAGIFDYLFSEGDDIVVGRLLTTSALGLYQVAYKISTLPITEVGDVVIKVTFPIFVKISDDSKRLKEAFLKTVLGVSVLVIPFGAILFFFTKPIVLILLGENWLETIPVLKVLAFFGAVRAINSSANPLFLSVKKQEYVTAVTLAGILGLAITIIPLVVKLGIVGAAISATIGLLASIPITIYFVSKILRRVK